MSSRSVSAIAATSAEISPAAAARRRMLAASTGIRCGALSGSLVSKDSAQEPVLPPSTSADTMSDASTTRVIGDPRRGGTGYGRLTAKTLSWTSWHGYVAPGPRHQAVAQARRAWPAGTPAATGHSARHGRPVHHESHRE